MFRPSLLPPCPTDNAPTQTPTSISTRSLQLSRLRIHLVQEFKIGPIQSRKNVLETNIVVIHDQIPHISLTHPPFLRSRRHFQHDLARDKNSTSSSSLILLMIVFSKKKKSGRFECCILGKRQIQHMSHAILMLTTTRKKKNKKRTNN